MRGKMRPSKTKREGMPSMPPMSDEEHDEMMGKKGSSKAKKPKGFVPFKKGGGKSY